MRMRRLLLLVVASLGAGASVAGAATLTVSSWHIWSGSQTLTKASCTVTGSATTTDTYVDESNPATSFGSNTTMSVRSNSGSRRWAFVRFDLSGCSIPSTGGADTATLKLRMTNAPASSRTLTVAPVLATWGGTLTWTQANALSYGSSTTTFVTGTSSPATLNVTVTVDVDKLIRNGTANYGWRISDLGSGSATTTFGTANNGTAGNRPQLVIDHAS